MVKYHDVLIIGSGVAALQLATMIYMKSNVKIITKSSLRKSNSYLAQGGVAAAVDPDDSPEKHLIDTLEAGRFHSNEDAAREIVQEAADLIPDLGHIFDRDGEGRLQLGLEGAHTANRIVHSGGDATGQHVMETLLARLPLNVHIEENIFVYELIMDHVQKRCIGAKGKAVDGSIHHYYARHTIIATGGCGQLYSFTSNAQTVTGDGIAMAYLAGADVADMEFVQFHPTLLYQNGEAKGLISEAVRGAGAVLVTEDGTPVMHGIHPLEDLAPRHIVSQTMFDLIKSGQHVYLDITKIDQFETRFPSITALCAKNGIRISEGRLPVAPGSHFLMGGIKTDLKGQTTIDGLYAIGEAACTGFHGANRLASNSLLEGLFQGKRLAEWINRHHVHLPTTPPVKRASIHKKPHIPDIHTLQEGMMKNVGIVRSKTGLTRQKQWLDSFQLNEIHDLDGCTVPELTGLLMGVTASLITESALKRTESRGGHFREDFPFEDDQHWLKKTIIHMNKGEVRIRDEYIKAALKH
ncbi:L-aspartate oxidase [Jeotgalibacillus sp. R-1-5s-1]|nr:L-aspartate oxidase [Jeotgalibacillus sp. R-1-5s-1]